MKLAKTTTRARTPRTKVSGQIAYAYAFILVVMALSQLFAFDEYIKHFEDFGFPWGSILAYTTPCVIVITEVLAVPFLLRIHLSQLMRIASMILSWMVALIWLKFSLWLVLVPNSVSNIGILGTKVQLIPGWWAVFLSLALLVMSIWASWGLWPLESGKGRKQKS